ncbi:MAG: glycosyltransferase [Candidatus Uhrbacteria bacterium]|nr:glycosyltransferase [Candidatus Uhrbacteria bacterium]
MKLSIIIPAKNEEDCLPQLLRSIDQQTMQPVEIIVADANSTDNTRKVASGLGAKVVNGGLPGVGRNIGASIATGDVLLFLDADVELTNPNFLQVALEEFEFRNLDIATVDVAPLGGTRYDVISHRVYNRYARMWGSKRPHAPGFCIFVRKSLHYAIGGFDEAVIFAEDHDYANRAGQKGKFGFLSTAPVRVSTRRQDRDGRFIIGVKYILAELHLLTIGPIRHSKFNYTFGHESKKEDYARGKPII